LLVSVALAGRMVYSASPYYIGDSKKDKRKISNSGINTEIIPLNKKRLFMVFFSAGTIRMGN
jgi:hypothetical protein